MTIAPGFSYEHAPLKNIFIKMRESKELFRKVFKIGKDRQWPLNHSPLYLDFLAGNQSYNCTPWGNPTRNVFGWQKPCYLLVDEGYAPSFQSLMEETPWHKYGSSKNPKCANCMAHCGFEATAAADSISNPLKAFWAGIMGPRTQGPMAPEPVPEWVNQRSRRADPGPPDPAEGQRQERCRRGPPRPPHGGAQAAHLPGDLNQGFHRASGFCFQSQMM